MKVFIKINLLILILMSSSFSYAQRAKMNKAQKEYDRFAYIDAQKIYLQVVSEGYSSPELFEKLGNTYYFNGDYENAARWYEKLMKEYPDQTEPKYYFRAAQSLKSLGDYKASDTLMKVFTEIGSRELVIQNFKSNPDYLKKIKAKPKKWVLEPAEINSEYTDFGSAFYGNKLVYASAKPDSTARKVPIYEWNNQPFFDLFEAEMDENGKLSNPKRLPGEINSNLHESSAVFTKDGNTVYFTRNNYLNGRKGKDRDYNIRLKLYKATKKDGKWREIVELPFNDASYSTAHPALSPDETRLYFSSDRPGTFGESDLWYVDIRGENEYGAPVNLGKNINTEVRESFPFISKENVLYFSSNGRPGLGGLDIFYTPLDKNGMPTEIIIMAEPVNGKKDDFAFAVDLEKDIAFLSSNRNTSDANDNIYRATHACKVLLRGTVKDEITKQLLEEADLALFNEENEKIDSLKTDKNGGFNFNLDCGMQYSLRVTKDDYESVEKIVIAPDDAQEIELPIAMRKIGCPPNDLGCRLSLQPIYFDFNKANIRPDAEVELAKIWAALKEYPELEIKIESHTDSRGSKEYNMELSEARAQATLEWLVNRGINTDRLTAKGYGESRLINECSDGADCTEAEHQLNRRSVFLIKEEESIKK
ncbi:flagellar motor protein MotB [Christiangramia fulva]|uniref:Flagellar motor protein MotB n=1 Tax=Christiangramia fulva TaxID=2126553 RepID=A0A2R3Z6P5_9FLAO|nr:OmpA family protein [Christiangramia fulva]AVR45973.1 flagellar motor protein MotB [Christiangramia fulva]